MYVIRAKPGTPLFLGRQVENRARQAVFDLSRWREVYGPGTVQLLVQHPGEEVPYPVPLEESEEGVVWTVTAADTARAGRYGRCELQYRVGDTVVKSEAWHTAVGPALGDPAQDPPEAEQGWLDRLLRAAQRVEEASIHSPIIRDGSWWVWDLEAGEYRDTGTPASGSGETGVIDHRFLSHRDAADQHPIEAVSGLDELTNLEILTLWNGGESNG